jgi:phosphocarrier protein FPr
MIGIVIVSHSETLAQGIYEVIAQMVQDKVPIATAGGVNNLDEPIGTDPMRVVAAIETVYSEDGVLVLMDLGSALMSAEAALEFLPEEKRQHIYLCEAPIVEGAIAASVRAMIGGDMAEMLADARGALQAKTEQLQPVLNHPAPVSALSAPAMGSPAIESGHIATATLTVVVPNRLGLHARPAAKLIELISRFAAQTTITHHAKTVSANSMNQVVTLGARHGEELFFRSSGQDAHLVLAAIAAFAAANFGDGEEGSSRALESAPIGDVQDANMVVGIPVSPGVAVGPVYLYKPTAPPVPERHVEDVQAEWLRLQAAVSATLVELQQFQTFTAQRASQSEAAIFAAHIQLLQDPHLLQLAQQSIEHQHTNAEMAWQQVMDGLAEQFRQLPDALLQQRAVDVGDISQRVLKKLTATEPTPLTDDKPAILVAHELTPSETANLKPELVLAMVTEQGGAHSHSAILARALGIPAIAGVRNLMARVALGQVIAVDGSTGRIWLAPDVQTQSQFQQSYAHSLIQHSTADVTAHLPAILHDGKRIAVTANIGSPAEAAVALAAGAEGVGLFRTEYLLLARNELPSEQEHYEAYVAAAQTFAQRPLTIRALDLGGDKNIPYLSREPEANPFLGYRGIRYLLDQPELFKSQLRALLRASAHHPIKFMLPMVSTVEEIQFAKAILREAQAELQRQHLPFDKQLAFGMMIETPAAVLLAPQFAHHVDFFSIGTNDLTQYLMAAERNNARVATLADPLQPAVLQAIQQVVQAAHIANLPVSVCGELASDVRATALLVGLGVDELSMRALSIGLVKARIRQLNLQKARRIANEALSCTTSAEVQALLDAGVRSG